MGVDANLYVGAYLLLDDATKKVECSGGKCEKCGEVRHGQKYCSKCGGEIVQREWIEDGRDPLSIFESNPFWVVSFEENIIGKGAIFIPDSKFKNSFSPETTYGESVSDVPDREKSIEEFTEKYGKLIDKAKKEYPNKTFTIKYGIVQYCS